MFWINDLFFRIGRNKFLCLVILFSYFVSLPYEKQRARSGFVVKNEELTATVASMSKTVKE